MTPDDSPIFGHTQPFGLVVSVNGAGDGGTSGCLAGAEAIIRSFREKREEEQSKSETLALGSANRFPAKCGKPKIIR
jgi:hypothetical protein